MKNCTYFFAVTLLSGSFVYSDQTSESAKQIGSQHHRLYIGPDVFFQRAQEKLNFDRCHINLTDKTVYGGVRIGYDYLKPRAFYFGTDGLVAIGRNSLKSTSTSFSDHYDFKADHRSKGSPLFANLEQRYGYTFQSLISSNSSLTPFAGIGGYYTRSQFNKESSSLSWLYGAVGLRVNQQFCENFYIGFNAKAMYIFAGWFHANMQKQKFKNIWGCEIAMPLTWNIKELYRHQFLQHKIALKSCFPKTDSPARVVYPSCVGLSCDVFATLFHPHAAPCRAS